MCIRDRLFDYFKQIFAQVSNPAIDSIREELVMSLTLSLIHISEPTRQAEMGNLPGFSGFHNDRCLKPNALSDQMMMDCSSGQK